MRQIFAFVIAAALGAGGFLGISCGGEEFNENPPLQTTSASTGGAGGAGGQGGAPGGAGGDGGSGGIPCFDLDLDGYTDCEGDCDDNDPASFPGASEVCGDGADNDCDGMPDPQALCQGIGTFVSTLFGQDPPAGLGTQALPVRTIAQGLANAQLIGGGVDVYVAEGHYAESIHMIEGIDLYGGFQCDTTMCSWTRDPLVYDTVIDNPDLVGVYFDGSITRATRFDGFRVMGLAVTNPANDTAAMTLEGGTPTIAANRIYGGAMNGGFVTAGIFLTAPSNDPAGALIQGNLIDGGDALEPTGAIVFEYGTNAVAEVIQNRIVGGVGRYTRAIAAFGAGPGTIIGQNEIVAGTSYGIGAPGISAAITVLGPNGVPGVITIDGNRINTDFQNTGSCFNQSRWCGGIESIGATLNVTNNVVFGIPSTRSFALYIGESEIPTGVIIANGNTFHGGGQFSSIGTSLSTAIVFGNVTSGNNVIAGRIRNNILLGGSARNRFGVFEDDKGANTMRPELLEANDFHFDPQVGSLDQAYRQWIAGAAVIHPTVADVETAFAWATSNLAADPLFGSGYHLLPGSPCIDAGVATEAPPIDIDGDARPLGLAIDVGADEAQ